MDDAFLLKHLKINAPEVDFDNLPAEEVQYAIDAMKKLSEDELNYMTRNTPKS